MKVIEERRESGLTRRDVWRGVGVAGAEAGKASFTEEVGKIWGGGEAGRREDMGRGTVINMNKGLDARMGDVSS